jgi:hypothetical protein
MDAALLDPETGKKMTAKQLKKRLARHIWSDARILLNYLDRKIGKVPDQVESKVTFVIEGQEQPSNTILADTVDALALPSSNDAQTPNSDDNSNT